MVESIDSVLFNQNMNPNPPVRLKKQCPGFTLSSVNEEYVRKLSVI